ncbi:response regulator with CheY-like receiver, AAA-type ATPase, and DNA-binding domains [Leptolyngbyaceae cyanobacterium JSC-12]|nr:response regulator with CheY-like receiver, AAA-type ATPase, and DNA-binding domains [Leptolyngbyaceae cyanobacterium JSC-12]
MTTRQLLLIDDEAAIRTIATASLQMTRTWKVLTAASGEQGIAIAQNHPLDAILLDVKMPKVDGLATLKALKANSATQAIPVILLTATIKVTTQQEYAQLGARAVIIKPFDPANLATQVETALNWAN